MIRALYQRFLKLPEKLRYLIAGGYNTGFGFVTFALLYQWLGADLHYLVILTINFFIAVGSSFLVLKYFVFLTRGNSFREYLRCHLSYLVLLGINMALLTLLVDHLGIGVLVAQLYCVVVMAVLGYVIHKLFSFKTS